MSTNAAINPRLVQVLTGTDLEEIKEKPTMSMLPGQYVMKVNKNKKMVQTHFEPNYHMLTCGHCNRKGKYDVGYMAVNINAVKKPSNDNSAFNTTRQNPEEYLQFTGYIRCKHCNRAGQWDLSNSQLMLASITTLLTSTVKPDHFSNKGLGKLELHDGNDFCWITDAEERMLEKLALHPQDAYLWNRLGNLYYRGGRPELAVAAYEQSLKAGPGQLESHYSLGKILMQEGYVEEAASHLRRTLVYARSYTGLKLLDLRTMLANSLQMLYYIHDSSKKQIPMLPSKEEFTVLDEMKEIAAAAETPQVSLLDLEFYPEELESFYPLAEIYLWHRREEFTGKERTLDKFLSPEQMYGGSIYISIIVNSKEKGEKIARICDHFGWKYSISHQFRENVQDFETALLKTLIPDNVYSLCPCGSGQKYKFCCASKMKQFDLNEYIRQF